MFNKINFNLLFLLLLCGQKIKAQGRFNDADHGNDFGSRLGDNDQWDIRHNIPGEPDVDYPIYSIVPRTSFTCENRHEGYYADIEARCQAFRICANTAINGNGFAFLCPNGTLFSQRRFVCDWYKNVDCTESENYYFMNEEIGKAFNNKEEMLEAAKHMIEFPLRNSTNAVTTKATTPFPRTTQRPFTTPPPFNKITTFKPAVTFASFTTRTTTPRPTTTTTTTQRPFTTTRRISSFNINSNKKDEVKDKRPTTRIPITKEESESADITSVVPPGNVYVSNLGELSTDIGSTFDPKSSVIIGDGPQDEPEAGLIDIRGSFGDTSTKTETHDVFRQNIDHVRNSFPANVNNFFSTPESQSAIKSGHAVSYQIQNRYTESAPQIQAASTSSLTLAEKINAGLNGFAKISVSDDSNKNRFANTVHSGEGSLITHSYNKFHPSGKSLSFADTINSAFQQGASSSHQNSYAFSDSTSSRGEQRRLGNGFSKQAQEGPHRVQVDDFRRGRQFQFQGSGFSRGGQGFGNDQRNAYLPPSGYRNTQGSAFRTQYETFETTSFEPTSYNSETVPNLLINVEDDDESYLDTKPLERGENDVHVKKRAEHLLLQGVHLTRYENNITDTTDYNLASSINSQLKVNTSPKHTVSSITRNIDLTTSTPTSKSTSPTASTTIQSSRKVETKTVSTETPLTKTLIYSFTQPKQDTDKSTPAPTGRFSYSINSRRQTVRPITQTKRPSVESTRNTTRRVNTSSRSNSRRKPTHKFSSRYSATQKPGIDDNDLTPEANSYGSRTNLNSIRNETRKYTTLKRTKVYQDTKNNAYTPRSRTRISVVSFNSTGNTVTPTSRPTTTRSSIIPEIKFDFGLQHTVQTQRTNGAKDNKGQAGNRGYTSSFNGFKVYPSQERESGKTGSTYVELPGTKIEIAKSQEQGHFTISNDPYQKQGSQPSHAPSSGYQPLDQYLKNTFPGQKSQQQSYEQTYHQQTPQQKTQQQTTNFYLPFPTVSTTKRPSQTGTYQIFPSVSQQLSPAYGQSPSTTKAPSYYTPTPNSFSIGTKPFSPFLEGIPIQRRLDIVEDDKEEGSLYTGVSSYHVPISSVGRLPGDLVALRRRRRRS